MTCANASATLPFGTIDTPLQGGVASGSELRQLRLGADAAAEDDSDRRLDDSRAGRRRGRRHRRLQPRAAGHPGAVPGLQQHERRGRLPDPRHDAMANGLHTISWTVTDNQGAIEGIGSRFFTVSNGVVGGDGRVDRCDVAQRRRRCRAARHDAARRPARLGSRGAVRTVRRRARAV